MIKIWPFMRLMIGDLDLDRLCTYTLVGDEAFLMSVSRYS